MSASRQVVKRIGEAAAASGIKPNAKTLEALTGAAAEYAQGNNLAFSTVPGVAPAVVYSVMEAYRTAYAFGCQRVFYATIPFGVVATIVACWIKDPSQYLTYHTAVRLDGIALEKKHVIGETRKGTGG